MEDKNGQSFLFISVKDPQRYGGVRKKSVQNGLCINYDSGCFNSRCSGAYTDAPVNVQAIAIQRNI
jgi:hypothetical protein